MISLKKAQITLLSYRKNEDEKIRFLRIHLGTNNHVGRYKGGIFSAWGEKMIFYSDLWLFRVNNEFVVCKQGEWSLAQYN